MTNVSEGTKANCLLTACFWLSCVGASIASEGALLYVTDVEPLALFTLSTTNGSPSLIGDFGLPVWPVDDIPVAMADLAYDARNDILYGTTTGRDNLYTINRVSGTAHLIGPLGVGLMHGLAYDNANGILYGASKANSALYRISTTTGQTTLVGIIGNFFPDSRDTVSGLAFNPADHALYVIDLATGAASLVPIERLGGLGR